MAGAFVRNKDLGWTSPQTDLICHYSKPCVSRRIPIAKTSDCLAYVARNARFYTSNPQSRTHICNLTRVAIRRRRYCCKQGIFASGMGGCSYVLGGGHIRMVECAIRWPASAMRRVSAILLTFISPFTATCHAVLEVVKFWHVHFPMYSLPSPAPYVGSSEEYRWRRCITSRRD